MDIDELIASNANLLKGFSAKKGRNNVSDDIFIYQNRPVKDTDWRKSRNVVFVNVFLPDEIPTFDSVKSVVLHNHTPFERCIRSRYCHILGYVVEDRHKREFDLVWNYLYCPQVPPLVSVRLNLEL